MSLNSIHVAFTTNLYIECVKSVKFTACFSLARIKLDLQYLSVLPLAHLVTILLNIFYRSNFSFGKLAFFCKTIPPRLN